MNKLGSEKEVDKLNKPTPDDVKHIFSEVYKFYVKHKDSKTDAEFESMVKESREISKAYPFKFCNEMLVNVMSLVDENVNK